MLREYLYRHQHLNLDRHRRLCLHLHLHLYLHPLLQLLPCLHLQPQLHFYPDLHLDLQDRLHQRSGRCQPHTRPSSRLRFLQCQRSPRNRVCLTSLQMPGPA